MSIEQEKMIVESLSSIYPMQKFEEDAIETVLDTLPSAEPKRGRWIKLDMHRGMADHKCTACEQECYVPTCMGEPLYAFCPNCGAKMRGENMSIREDVELYTKLSGEDGSHETIATIGAYLRGYRQGKEDAEPHWIPVTERLPEEEGEYLVTSVYQYYRDGRKTYKTTVDRWSRNGAGKEWVATSNDAHIAWMPLPEPYKGVTK